MGSLETEVLRCLWAANAPLTPREVLDCLDLDLAYTTVMTILSRLWQKGLVDRQRIGKAFAYRPLISEAAFAADRMRTVLAGAGDLQSTLSSFVEGLSKKEAKALRAIVGQLGQSPR